MAALTTYFTSTNNAGTLSSTARNLTNSAPSSEATATTKVAKATGWGEIYARGSTGTWPAGGAEPAPSGNGFIWEVTTLEGQRFSAANWTPSIKLATSVSSGITVSAYARAYKRSAAGVYTLIARASKTAWALTSTASAQTFAAASGSQTDLGVGDKLYVDLVVQVTANTANSTTATINLYENGGAADAYASPGYAATPFAGTGAASLKALTALGAGTLTVPAFGGTGAATVNKLSSSAAGAYSAPAAFAATGSGSAALVRITASGAGARTLPVFAGTGAGTLKRLTAVGAGTPATPHFAGASVVLLKRITEFGAGLATVPHFAGTSVGAVKRLIAAGAGGSIVPYFSGAGATTIKATFANSAGSRTVPQFSGVAAIFLRPVNASGAQSETHQTHRGNALMFSIP